MRKYLLLIPLLALTACGSLPTTIYKGEGVVISSVDGAMKGWADWVKNPANKVPQSQRDQVHYAYNQYFLAQQVAKAALEKYLASKSPDDATALNTANAAVSVAKNAFIDLVVSFTHPN